MASCIRSTRRPSDIETQPCVQRAVRRGTACRAFTLTVIDGVAYGRVGRIDHVACPSRSARRPASGSSASTCGATACSRFKSAPDDERVVVRRRARGRWPPRVRRHAAQRRDAARLRRLLRCGDRPPPVANVDRRRRHAGRGPRRRNHAQPADARRRSHLLQHEPRPRRRARCRRRPTSAGCTATSGTANALATGRAAAAAFRSRSVAVPGARRPRDRRPVRHARRVRARCRYRPPSLDDRQAARRAASAGRRRATA